MNCKTHVEVPASGRCAGCAEPFCENCLVEIEGQHYCGSCKVMAVKGQPLVVAQSTVVCEDAKKALTFALISIFCFGFILAPVAVVTGAKAKKQIAQDPQLVGSGKATAAILIGVTVILFWIVGIIARVGEASGNF